MIQHVEDAAVAYMLPVVFRTYLIYLELMSRVGLSKSKTKTRQNQTNCSWQNLRVAVGSALCF